MEYVEKMCPKCNQLMQVPGDRTTIICMFCGEQFATGIQLDNTEFDELLNNVKEQLPRMLLGIPNGLSFFKKNLYEDFFRQTYKSNIDLLTDIDNIYKNSDDSEEITKELAEDFVARIAEKLQEIPKKNAKEKQLMDYNFVMAVYVFPMLLEYKGIFSNSLTDALVAQWSVAFKNARIGKATFEDIQGGFRSKLCYITTAICESFNKPMDCYELNLFKTYRDEYLSKQEQGQAMIEEYYNIAPTIVKRINKQDNSVEVYKDLYTGYLYPCIQMIEEKKYDACKEIYIHMVNELQIKYMG